MKAPEWVMSTPRLIAILMTLTACYWFIADKIWGTEFLSLASLAFAFFFQQRKPENQAEPVKEDEPLQKAYDLHSKTDIPDVW